MIAPPVRVVVWLVEGTCEGWLDAAVQILPPDARVTLLHVTPSDVGEVTEAATAGLLGRSFRVHRPIRRFEEAADQEPSEILKAAAPRLGRENSELLHLRGRVEREVVGAVVEGVDLLVVARDGDRSRLGPHGLGQRHSLHCRPRTLSRASGVAGRGAGHRVDTAGA
jgi:hypothetical protein